MTVRRPSLEDLLVLSRRGALGEAEEERLAQAARESAETRLVLRALEGFESEAAVEPGDDARLERVVRATLRRAVAQRRSQVWLVLSAAAVGALFASIVIAAVSRWESRSRSHVEVTAPLLAPVGVAMPGHGGPGQAEPASAASEASVSAPSPATPTPPPVHEPGVHRAASGDAERARATVAPSAKGPAVAAFPADASEETPSALFAAGNAARVSGDDQRAAALYRRLQSQFGGSSEAHASQVSLGMILLRQGAAEGALASFRAYESQGGGATLAEASWGEAQALALLGRRDEERRVLSELMTRYPGSAYASAAQKRLRELH